MRGRSRKILVGIAVLTVGLGGMYAFAMARSKARLRATYMVLEQDGRPMRAIDILPPEVPDAQNAALLYRKAALLFKGQPAPKNKHLLEYLAGLASSFVRDTLEPDERIELDELMAREVVISALATTGEALQCPACRFDHDYDNGLYTDVLAARAMHHLTRRDTEVVTSGDLRHLARLWGGRACLEAEAGRTSQAWDRVRAQFRFAEALRREPISTGHFPRFGAIGDLCRVIRKLCEIALPDESDYQGIEALLKDQVDIAPLVYALDAERLLRGEWLFNLPRNRLYEALQRDDLFPSQDGTPEVLSRFDFRIATLKPRFVANHAAYLRMMHHSVQLLEGPYFRFESASHQEFDKLAGHSRLTRKLAPMIQLEKRFHCDMVANVHLTRTGLALLQYQKTHGTFPESLDALGLEDLIDPYVDKLLHYRTEGAGFVVYSVGEDQKDNGGTPKPPRDTSGRRQKKKPEYDLIWRFSRGTGPVAGGGGR